MDDVIVLDVVGELDSQFLDFFLVGVIHFVQQFFDLVHVFKIVHF